MTSVKERDWRCQQTFAATKIVLENSRGIVNLIFSHVVHWKILNGKRKIVQRAIGTVSSVDYRLSLCCRQFLEELFSEIILIFPLRRQVTLHGSDKCPSGQAKCFEIFLTLLLRNGRAVVERVSHANKVTCVINIHSPILSGFVPSLVGRICAKH